MTASFDENLPTAKDRIRSTLGDTNQLKPLLQDETIQARINQSGETLATAQLAEGLANFYAQQPSSISLGGDLSVAFKRIEAWQDTAKRYYQSAKDEAVIVSPSPTAKVFRFNLGFTRQL